MHLSHCSWHLMWTQVTQITVSRLGEIGVKRNFLRKAFRCLTLILAPKNPKFSFDERWLSLLPICQISWCCRNLSNWRCLYLPSSYLPTYSSFWLNVSFEWVGIASGNKFNLETFEFYIACSPLNEGPFSRSSYKNKIIKANTRHPTIALLRNCNVSGPRP